MATLTWHNGICFVLLYIISHAVAGKTSGVLSNLYKKAAEENRPMILVLDSSLTENSGKNRADVPKSLLDISNKKSQTKPALPNSQKWYNIISQLGQQNYISREKSSSHRGSVGSRGHSRNRDKKRLRIRYDRDSRDRRDRDRYNRDRRDRNRNDRDRHDHYGHDHDRDGRDRHDHSGYDHDHNHDHYRDHRDRIDRGIDDRDRHDRYDRDRSDRDDKDRRDRDRDDRDRRDRDRSYRLKDYRDRNDRNRVRDDEDGQDDLMLRALIENKLKDNRPAHEKARDSKKDKALRASVIKNLLRISNDLNCEAQIECQDECDPRNYKKKNECDNRCEEKFKCEPIIEEIIDSCGFDSCAEESDENPSTKGITFKDETPKCKRC